MMSEQREQLAAIQHEIWAHWMKYQFSCCDGNGDGSLTIPAEKVERWQRQLDTAYADLTERERESDREQADKVIDVLRKAVEIDGYYAIDDMLGGIVR